MRTYQHCRASQHFCLPSRRASRIWPGRLPGNSLPRSANLRFRRVSALATSASTAHAASAGSLCRPTGSSGPLQWSLRRLWLNPQEVGALPPDLPTRWLRNIWLEQPSDLAALCRDCHHARHLDRNGRFWRTRRQWPRIGTRGGLTASPHWASSAYSQH